MQEFLKAATTSNVVQFSFLTSSGFRGVPAAKGFIHPVQSADCWDEQGHRHRSGYQRFATLVNSVSVFSPEGGTLVTDRRVDVHLVYSQVEVVEGAYFQAGCVRAWPEPCIARGATKLSWDFELLRSVDGDPCVPPRCAAIHVDVATETEPAAERACTSYREKNAHPRSSRRVVESSTSLDTRRLRSELVHKCTARLQAALASLLGCNVTKTTEWLDPVVLPASFGVKLSEVWIGGFPGFP